MNTKPTFWQYFNHYNSNLILGVTLVVLLTPSLLAIFTSPVWWMVAIPLTFFVLHGVHNDYNSYKQIKEPTWALVDYIFKNDAELADKWVTKLEVVKDEVVLYTGYESKIRECYNQTELGYINEVGIGRLRQIIQDDKVGKELGEKQKLRNQIMKTLQGD